MDVIVVGSGIAGFAVALALRARGIARLVAACIVVGPWSSAHSQTKEAFVFPSKPIRWIIPSAAGTPPDWLARLFGERLSSAFG
jgi:2-polyprenyl-6-methoxyphenol hydroxylase-like FAD-dependent oxidoreductase